MGIRDLSRKGEDLIETGSELQMKETRLQEQIMAESRALSAAYEMLRRAAEVDENGMPRGDVLSAQMMIERIRQNIRLAEWEKAELAKEAERIDEQKRDVVSEIDRINRAEQGNVEKLRLLQSRMMSKNAADLISDLIARMNQGEEAKDHLLQSMGQQGGGIRYANSFSGGSGVGVPGADPGAIFMSESRAAAAGLSQSQRSALQSYTGTSYTRINEYYRGKAGYMSPALEQSVKSRGESISSAIRQNSLSVPMHLYRGVDNLGKLLDREIGGLDTLQLKEALVGTVYRDDGFMSTSMKEAVAKKYAGAREGGIFSIEIPAGFSAFPVGDIESFRMEEMEILLDKGIEWDVVDVSEGDYGQPVVHIRPIKEKTE